MSNSKPKISNSLLPVKRIKNLPAEMITHMPFIIFQPKEVRFPDKGDQAYQPMVIIYFSRNLDITPLYPDGTIFDHMPTDNNCLSFTATFDKSVKYTLMKNTYYFATSLGADKQRLGFLMNMDENTVTSYNAANPTNKINGHFSDEEADQTTSKFVQFINAECDVVIPPFPPS